ncbi:hypothetical protein A3C87_01585 [Candidatus Kaiserbacteria bacterium RIFCSPHIGHO2_02_FULL_49_34]|uniref:HTH deoR-type domain-containing protein n=1 Tax=Candidatus Kaiserbacteria bacterium RIFCSPHIGHO2_02_FULL_49_34 TaxID=1798491 RepID=A0A1F6DII9_9BACT|nr:MAG: hypothetical protein A3C87_01585 [Candidatus Kaiserbacteria bacterium RIFCSPHIGHO2_02_FULL_49_34]
MFARGAERLIHDAHYVAYVFKKTEKVCNAVYFITSQITDVSQGHGHASTSIVREVEGSALALLGKVQTTLSRTRDELPAIAPTLSIGILELSSKLSILAATGRLSREHLLVFQQELDTLERAIYFHEPDRAISMPKVAAPRTIRETPKAIVTTPSPRKPTPSPAAPLSPTPAVSDTSSRSALIKDVLMKSPASSIKDISRAFPDVSEKTVQREVNTLIARGAVRKEGEKRWSRYSLVS